MDKQLVEKGERSVSSVPGCANPGRSSCDLRWKKPLDLFCIVLSAPLWLPCAVLVIAWIKLVSRGGVLFHQERVGLRGAPFRLYKFRTMLVNAETRHHEEHLERLVGSNDPMVKLDALGDPRLIPGGRCLRATGLDELPQLINILRGEMSLVGPRPCTSAELKAYKPAHMRRFNGLPGITGNWQVNGKNETSFRRMVALDIRYLRTASVRSDLVIMARTIPVILREVVRCWKKTRAAGSLDNGSMPHSLNGTAHSLSERTQSLNGKTEPPRNGFAAPSPWSRRGGGREQDARIRKSGRGRPEK